MNYFKRDSQKKSIGICLALIILCTFLVGCNFNSLHGQYTSESGQYSVKFNSNEECTWYQDGTFFEGTYYWDGNDGCYYLEILGNGFYQNTRFSATKDQGDLIINGGTVCNERFSK